MLSRRDLLMSGALVSRLRPADALQQQRGVQNTGNVEDDLHEIRDAIRGLGDVRKLTQLADVTTIQERQRVHFKVNQKYPNYIDIGLLVWERLYMWHLENRLPLKAVRTPEGRMEMEFMFTTLILRPDLADAMISNPYD